MRDPVPLPLSVLLSQLKVTLELEVFSTNGTGDLVHARGKFLGYDIELEDLPRYYVEDEDPIGTKILFEVVF